jgi:hypothetical protein
MPRRTLYVRDCDLPIWEAAEKTLGEKSMSTLVTEALLEKLGRPIDGFLNILGSQAVKQSGLGEFAVMFAPTNGPGGAVKPHYCANRDELKTFLDELGLTPAAITETVQELQRRGCSTSRLSLRQDKIDLI